MRSRPARAVRAALLPALCLLLSLLSLPSLLSAAPARPAEAVGVAGAGEARTAPAPVPTRSELAAQLRRGERLRDDGRIEEALAVLEAAHAGASQLEDGALRLAVEGALGGALVEAGRSSAARQLLEPALARARGLEPAAPALVAALANELARSLEAVDAAAALDLYREAAVAADQAGDRRRAFVARANAAVAAGRSVDPPRARAAAAEARAAGERAGGGPGVALAWLRLGRAWQALAAGPEGSSAGQAGASEPEAVARSSALRALALGEAAGDARVVAHARGELAELDARAGRLEPAESQAWQALRAAQALGDRELTGRARARLARLLLRGEGGAGDPALRDRAIDLLRAALDDLAALRPALGRPRGAVGPRPGAGRLDRLDADTHLEAVDLLLRRAGGASDAERAQADLRLAREIVERGKAAELRDYFRDECVDAYREQVADPSSVSPTAAVVYPIALPDRLALLVSHGDTIRPFRVEVDAAAFEAEVRDLRRWIVNRTRARYRRHARRLHDWLFAPIEDHLAALGVDTLVFVPGGSLRTVPLAALWDGERFLIERYAVATVPGLELVDPRPVDPEGLRVFAGGVSEARQGFTALPGVPAELADVAARFDADVLVDEAFETEAVQRTLERQSFGVVHLATHARFGATPEDSFLLTWDGRLGLDALADAVGVFRYRDQPLELLLLSACETAAGDDRAALGLAGVAVKAGARSALASLWSVRDEASRKLVSAFYAALAEPGVSRAEALRRAQRALLAERRLSHPADWAPFLMISGWL